MLKKNILEDYQILSFHLILWSAHDEKLEMMQPRRNVNEKLHNRKKEFKIPQFLIGINYKTKLNVCRIFSLVLLPYTSQFILFSI